MQCFGAWGIMQKFVCLIVLVMLAILAIASSLQASIHAQPSLAFFEAALDDKQGLAKADRERHCVCARSGLCGGQQPIGLSQTRDFLEELSASLVLRPQLCSSAPKSHIVELDPPTPRTHLC